MLQTPQHWYLYFLSLCQSPDYNIQIISKDTTGRLEEKFVGIVKTYFCFRESKHSLKNSLENNQASE